MSETAKTSPGRAAEVKMMRSQLGRVRGLGSARAGTEVWWMERLTSIALVPLTVWFVWTCVHLAGGPAKGVAGFLANPINGALMLGLVVVTFRHMQLGLRVVVEDYIHTERQKMAVLLGIDAACWVLGLIAAVATLRLAFTG